MHRSRVRIDPFETRPRAPRASAVAPCALAFGALLSVVSAVSAAPADPSGLWATKEDESIIKIAPCGTFFCGTLVWLKEPNEDDGTPKLDTKNADKRLRGRPMLGIELLIDLAPVKNHWRGKAYNPEDGKTYDITFKLASGKAPAEKAEVEGCFLGFLCSSETFTRVRAIPGTDSVPAPSTPAEIPPASPKPPTTRH